MEAYADDVKERNVAAQDADPDSLLNHYRALIRLRSDHEALRIGKTAPVDASQDPVYGVLRYTEAEMILFVANLSAKPLTDYSMSLKSGPLQGAVRARLLGIGAGDVAAPQPNAAGGFDNYKPLDTLPGYAALFIRLTP